MGRMELDCPCTKDCPDRKAGCTVGCTHGWDEYHERKMKQYALREERAERRQQTAGYMKIKRQAIRREQKRKNGR